MLTETDFNKQIEALQENYDWQTLSVTVANLRDIPCGPPLNSESFSRGDINKEPIQQIEDALNSNSVVILAGATRMGKTTVLKFTSHYFGDEDTEPLAVDGEDIEESDLEDFGAGLIVLDEFSPTEHNVELIETLKTRGYRIIISPAFSLIEESLDKIQGNQLIEVPKVKREKMIEYVSKKLDVKDDDDLVSLITELSDGSLYIANTILTELKEGLEDVPSFHLLDRIKRASQVLKRISLFTNWRELRELRNDRFLHLIPNPEFLESLDVEE